MDRPLAYCDDLWRYARRETREVRVGGVGIGGANPIRIQSMITADTRDTAACVREVLELAEAGSELVRITAQTRVYAANLENIAREVRAAGCEVPLVADIHFKPDAALEAAKWVEKVRVNPGNYADKKKFEVREYSDQQYAAELERIREQFAPLVERCKELDRAMRIGTNHGSLSDRIMNRFGDTPEGMVESALEFARIARELDYHNFVFSMKASNPKVMIEAYRLLVARLERLGGDWNYPIHLGVTEAGDGEDGRIKSAIGIGSLLADGIGDTIRVSLTEDAVHEIPVAEKLAAPFQTGAWPGGWSVPLQSVRGASRSQSLQQVAASVHPDFEELERRTSSHLPHWRVPDATYAVSFRLEDSLPDAALEDYRRKRRILLDRIERVIEERGSRDALPEVLGLRDRLDALGREILDPALRLGHGECHLAEPEIARCVEEALHFFDGERYDLFAWAIMPNHVHALLRPRSDCELSDILHSWKSFTAKRANGMLDRSGPFWQEESYDHVVRDGADFRNQLKYVLTNPGPDGGPWTGSKFGRSWKEASQGAGRSPDGLERDAPATSLTPTWDPFSFERRRSEVIEVGGHELGGDRELRVAAPREHWKALEHKLERLGDYQPELVHEEAGVVEIDPRDDAAVTRLDESPEPRLVSVADGVDLGAVHAFRWLAARIQPRHPILLKDTLDPAGVPDDFVDSLLLSARVLGSLICDGIGDAVLVRCEKAPGQSLRIAYNILQASGARIFKTDYVACPSCGRTLFNLQQTTQRIREATGHLKGVRIAVMGCIVNGPGEMADADFGYVGGAPGKINLYVGKQAVKFNIPEAEAVERLVDLIREHGKWIDAPAPQPAEA